MRSISAVIFGAYTAAALQPDCLQSGFSGIHKYGLFPCRQVCSPFLETRDDVQSSSSYNSALKFLFKQVSQVNLNYLLVE